MTTLPESASAVKLAEILVNGHAAACVHILPPGQSVYRWKEAIERSCECTLLIKSTEAAYPLLESLIIENHPYDLPEILAVPVVCGLDRYLSWIAAGTV